MSTIQRTLAVFALALSTAMSAYGQSPHQPAAVTTPLEGGGVQHIKSGLKCPATLANLTYDSVDALKEVPEVACVYLDPSREQQLSYFILTPPENQTRQELAIAFARGMIKDDPTREPSLEHSKECQAGIAGAMQSLGMRTGEGITPPCFVLVGENRSILVSVWERDGWTVANIISGPDTRITNAQAAVFALSNQDRKVAPEPAPTPTPAPQREGVSKKDVDEFCGADRTQPTKGVQFNGKRVPTSVLSMQPGRYTYPNNGALFYYRDQTFLIRLPSTRKGIFGTDGDDMMMAGGILAGCFVEQLSEIFERNELDREAFDLEELWAE